MEVPGPRLRRRILEAAATEVVDVEAAPDLQSYEAVPIDALWDEINIE